MIDAGKMSHRLHFRDTSGQLSPDYWCMIKHISSVGLYVSGVQGQVESLEVRMRYCKFGPPGGEIEPTVSMTVRIDGKHDFNIKTIENVNLEDEEWHMIVTRG